MESDAVVFGQLHRHDDIDDNGKQQHGNWKESFRHRTSPYEHAVPRQLNVRDRIGRSMDFHLSSVSDRLVQLPTDSSCWRCCAPVTVDERISTFSLSTRQSSISYPVCFSCSPSPLTGWRRLQLLASGSSASCSRLRRSWLLPRTVPSSAWSLSLSSAT